MMLLHLRKVTNLVLVPRLSLESMGPMMMLAETAIKTRDLYGRERGNGRGRGGLGKSREGDWSMIFVFTVVFP